MLLKDLRNTPPHHDQRLLFLQEREAATRTCIGFPR